MQSIKNASISGMIVLSATCFKKGGRREEDDAARLPSMNVERENVGIWRMLIMIVKLFPQILD